MPKLTPGLELELDIEKLIPGGEGLARYQGQSIFVPTGLPGDQIRAEIISSKPHYARALIREVLTASALRTEPPCPVVNECGGCQWQHQLYSSQLAQKRLLLLENMHQIGKWDAEKLQALCRPVLGMSEPWHYRNKGQFPFQNVAGKVQAGFYAPRSHQLVALTNCLIHHPVINQILAWVTEAVQQRGFSAYDENSHRGDLRHLIVRHGLKSGQTLVGFVCRSEAPAGLKLLGQELMRQFPSVVGVLQNINSERTNRILGPQTQLLCGRSSYLDQLDTLRFEVSLPSFFQVNPLQTEVLYQSVAQLAQLQPQDTVIDAYSGAGTISLWLARQCKEVIGIEVVPEATRDAEANARLNGLERVRFLTGKVENLLPGLIRQTPGRPLLVLDPPRKGCEASVLQSVAASEAARVVYVSCNPATLARDSGLLRDSGFELTGLQPVDMFPHTHHLETVALFERA